MLIIYSGYNIHANECQHIELTSATRMKAQYVPTVSSATTTFMSEVGEIYIIDGIFDPTR